MTMTKHDPCSRGRGAWQPPTMLAVLAVVVVMVVHAVCKLLLMPFRLLRGLFRHSGKPAQVTVR
jgi:hypothetical protein